LRKYYIAEKFRKSGNKLGRLDEMQAKNRIEPLIRFLARFSEKTLLVLSGLSMP